MRPSQLGEGRDSPGSTAVDDIFALSTNPSVIMWREFWTSIIDVIIIERPHGGRDWFTALWREALRVI